MKLREKELVRYSMKGPGHGRRSFTIYLDIKLPGGQRSYTKVEDERISAINAALLCGAKDLASASIQVREIIQDLYKADPRCRKSKNVHNRENWHVLEKFWKEVYENKKLINVYAAKNELKNAIDVLGELSIFSASREEIQSRVDAKYSGDSQRRIVVRLRQLLRSIGREKIVLRQDQKDIKSVTYLSEPDFRRVLMQSSNDLEQALLELCYYSGLRIGEAYSLDASSLLPNKTIRVAGQIDRQGRRRQTKTKRARIAYLFPSGLSAFDRWTRATLAERAAINRQEASRKLMKRLCRLAFPSDSSKHLTFHALRHCYAINLLNKGVSMSLVAQSLGNTLSVCQQYYVGFELTSESIEAITAIVAKGNS
jgi:site-specific recombinase XerD